MAICPRDALIIEIDKKKGVYEPRLIKDRCNNCGICIKVCPGLGIVRDRRANQINYYIGHSNNYNIRYNCSSGGLITQILIYALENKIIDGALVTRMKKDAPLEPEPFIARTKEEILEASKSKYCPVPANIALKRIINAGTGEKFAIVGLPCHIAGAKKAEGINKELEDKILFHLGLICAHTPTFHATEFVLNSFDFNSKDIKEIKYRGEGWPGGLRISNKDNKSIFLDEFDPYYWGVVFSKFFVPKRCGLCDDKECSNSDAAFGDAWLPEIMFKERIGSSIIVSYDTKIDDLLKKAESEKQITLQAVPEDMFLRSQSLLQIKTKAYARIIILNLLNRRTSTWNATKPNCTVSDYIDAILFFINNYFVSKHHLYGFIQVYCKIYKYGSTIKHYLLKPS